MKRGTTAQSGNSIRKHIKGLFAFSRRFSNICPDQESEMFIRNKGTKEKPRYFVVENYRVHGQINPQQRTILSLGKHPTVDAAISFFSGIVKIDRSTQSIILKENPNLGSIAHIRYRVKKLRDLKTKMESNFQAKSVDREIIGLKKSSRPLSKTMKLRLKIMELNKTIHKLRRDGNIATLDADARR